MADHPEVLGSNGLGRPEFRNTFVAVTPLLLIVMIGKMVDGFSLKDFLGVGVCILYLGLGSR